MRYSDSSDNSVWKKKNLIDNIMNENIFITLIHGQYINKYRK